jgi:membrane protease YdiL (CAAX protease family)
VVWDVLSAGSSHTQAVTPVRPDHKEHDMATRNDGSGATSFDPDRDDDRTLAHDHDHDHDRTVADRHRATRRDDHRLDDAHARDKFGGLNLGAAFFGWIVAIGVAILLAGIVGAILTAVGSSVEVTQNDAERSAGTIALSTAIVLLVILALAYYAGGYVAGRMSRFDGARQGVGVWVIGLLVTLIAIALGAIFGNKYNVLERVDLPRIPISSDDLSWGGIIAAVAVVVVTLLFAVLGGVLGHRYHDRVDRAVRH